MKAPRWLRALKALIGYGAQPGFPVPQETCRHPQRPPAAWTIISDRPWNCGPNSSQLKNGLVARQLLVDAAKADR